MLDSGRIRLQPGSGRVSERAVARSLRSLAPSVTLLSDSGGPTRQLLSERAEASERHQPLARFARSRLVRRPCAAKRQPHQVLYIQPALGRSGPGSYPTVRQSRLRRLWLTGRERPKIREPAGRSRPGTRPARTLRASLSPEARSGDGERRVGAVVAGSRKQGSREAGIRPVGPVTVLLWPYGLC